MERDDFPDSAPYLALTYLYIGQSDFGQANDQVRAGLVAVPGDPQLLATGVFVSLDMRDNAEAGRRFEALDQLYPGTRDALGAGCLYYYGIGQAASALPFCAHQTEQSPNDHAAHSNYGWAALDANQFQLAFQEFSQAYKLSSTKGNLLNLTETQAVDLEWGITMAYYYSGDKTQAQKFLQFIRQNYPASATVTGLNRLPLLWSKTTMSRIETILREFPPSSETASVGIVNHPVPQTPPTPGECAVSKKCSSTEVTAIFANLVATYKANPAAVSADDQKTYYNLRKQTCRRYPEMKLPLLDGTEKPCR